MTAESGLPLQPPDSLCHPILGWHAQTPRPMVGPGVPRDPGDTHWCAAFPEALADGLAERTKDGLVPIGRYDAEVVSAIPPDLAWVVPGSPGGCSCVWPWRVHTGETTSLFTNQCRNGRACSSLIARGSGLPIGVTPKYTE